MPAPLTTTSRLQERASSLRPPLPEVGRAPGAEPLSPLALTRRPAPSWPQHRSVTGARRGGTDPVPRPPPQRRPRAGGAGQDGDGAGVGSPAHVVPWARAVPPPPFACSQSPCPPARHLRPQSAPKAPARLSPIARLFPACFRQLFLSSLFSLPISKTLEACLCIPACGACPNTITPLPGPDLGQAKGQDSCSFSNTHIKGTRLDKMNNSLTETYNAVARNLHVHTPTHIYPIPELLKARDL